MSEESPTSSKHYQFFNPITQAGTGAVTPNFHLFGAGDLDVKDFKKNIPKFEELALDFGMGTLKKAILKNTFSLVTTKTTQPDINRFKGKFPEPVQQTDEPLRKIGTSMFGTPVFSNLSIVGGSYKNNQGEVIAQYEDIKIDAVIFEVTRDNNIIQTDMQGRDNSVNEYISGKSWNINCKGKILTVARDTYPNTDVVQLVLALNSNKSLRVTSWYLNMFSIYNIIIKKKTFMQEEGGIEYQRFEFDAVADYPLILKRK